MLFKMIAAIALLFFFTGCFTFEKTFAQETERRDLITDPAISSRCKQLLNQRNNKVRMRQRLRALLLRNEKLLNRVEEKRESVKSKLQFTHTRIENNLRLSHLKIQKMEEDIVRRGCPGVAL